ncbi:MAG: helix-turn-helix transcriptional regulator [Pseudonocardiales bacterium]|nr:helix-turn-helix transcriptional regulator [Pseudonocardiales bacterium]
MDRIDPGFFDDDTVRAALAARDVGAVYRLLQRVGVSQRRIAALTGQSQSEVNEILRQGRQVLNVLVLERIADGLGIPRERLGVGYGEWALDASPAEEVEEIVKRRALMTTAMVWSLDQQGTPYPDQPSVQLALPTDDPLPTRLGMADVQELRSFTRGLVTRARYYGGHAGAFADAARRYTRWLAVPATEDVKTALALALAELHTEAGLACHDAGLDGRGHFIHAFELAGKAGDTYGVANAAWHAGLTLVRSGHPNDALKLFQLGQFRLRMFPPSRSPSAPMTADDSWLPVLTARLIRSSATAYAVMGGPKQADRCLAEADEGWAPPDVFDRAGTDASAAGIQCELGRLEAAEQFATRAVRGFGEGPYRRGQIRAGLLLAEVHVRAGEPEGLTLAHQAIEEVRTLRSVAVRRERLIPLATALDARPGSDGWELARMARQVATTPI